MFCKDLVIKGKLKITQYFRWNQKLQEFFKLTATFKLKMWKTDLLFFCFEGKCPRTLNIEETLNSGYQAVKFEVSAFTIKLQTMDF